MSFTSGPVCHLALCKQRVLVVDNEPTVRGDHVENLTRWNYTPIVAEGRGAALLRDAREKAARYRCHVALVDMRLLNHDDRNDISGLDLVPQLRPTLSIIVSGYGDLATAREALIEKGAVDFVGKQDGPEKLKHVIDKALHATCACTSGMTIAWPDKLSSAQVGHLFFRDDPDVPPDEANDVLGRLFPNARALRLETIAGAQRMPSLAPRSRALVLQVWEDDRQPVVVKLARRQRTQRELERYSIHIDHKLPGLFYASLQRSVELWDIGGAAYEFMGVSFRNMRLFSQYYADEPAESIIRSLRHLFDETWADYYRQPSTLHSASLFATYSEVWGPEWHMRLRQFPDQGDQLRFAPPLDQLRLPNPIVWIRRRVGLEGGPDHSRFDSTATAITHGDLLGDNIFVDADGRVWVIDYERTGPGPLLQDFVELEADILTRLTQFQPAELRCFLALALGIAQPRDLTQPLAAHTDHPEAAKALQIIGQLRQIAANRAGTAQVDARQYLWGLLFNMVFSATLLAKSEENSARRERALLLGGVLCDRLDHWDSAWPPQEWVAMNDETL